MSENTTKLIIRDLVLNMSIGVYEHEKAKPQRVLVNIEALVKPPKTQGDDIEGVVSYEDIVRGVDEISAQGHIHLVETFAEDIAALCLKDNRVLSAKVYVTKPDIFDHANAVGVEITRFQKQ